MSTTSSDMKPCKRCEPPRTKNKPHRVTRARPEDASAGNRIPIKPRRNLLQPAMTSPAQTAERLPVIERRPVDRSNLIQVAQGADSYLRPWGPRAWKEVIEPRARTERCSDKAGQAKDRQGTGGGDQPQCFYGGAFQRSSRWRIVRGLSPEAWK